MLKKDRIGRYVGMVVVLFLNFVIIFFSAVYKEHIQYGSKVYSSLNTQLMN